VRVVHATPGFPLAALAVALVLASPSRAAEPPNRSDPCSREGRNTCGTLGVGLYGEGRYGIRWFGDFRGAVAGRVPAFCIDSRFWYASAAYRYAKSPPGVLRNRDREVVPAAQQRRLAYAVWAFGRSAAPRRQAAVALYVHAQMGDARPGEVDPDVLDRRVAALYERIAADAARYHGPYRIETRFGGRATVGKPSAMTIRVLSAKGHALPRVRLSLTADDALTVPGAVQTDGAGVARVTLTAARGARSSLRIETAPVASTLPSIFRATTGPAAVNAQRLAAPASQRVETAIPVTARAAPTVATTVSAAVARAGSRIFDRIRVRGLGRTSARVRVELFGPFATRAAIDCRRRPSWTGSVVVAGDGLVRSPAVRLAKAGFYAYRERLVGAPLVDAFTTDCPLAEETSLVAPRIVTGGADPPGGAPAADARAARPTRVLVPSVGIDAPVAPVAIDVRHGTLGVPGDIRRAGWWKDGRVPGATSGAVLIAGHVDSAKGGPGAFFALHQTRGGADVQVRTAGGRVVAYRVVSVRAYRKDALPTSVYASDGSPRLVLVTCGGPFDPATRRYRDNIVVTAVPG
jgi:Sortase domain